LAAALSITSAMILAARLLVNSSSETASGKLLPLTSSATSRALRGAMRTYLAFAFIDASPAGRP
jgi:hypothetical protein